MSGYDPVLWASAFPDGIIGYFVIAMKKATSREERFVLDHSLRACMVHGGKEQEAARYPNSQEAEC